MIKIKVLKSIEYQKVLEKNELQRVVISLIMNRKIFHKSITYNKHFKINKTNFCLLTSRSKSVYRKYSLSRIKVREICFEGNINGLKKISW